MSRHLFGLRFWRVGDEVLLLVIVELMVLSLVVVHLESWSRQMGILGQLVMVMASRFLSGSFYTSWVCPLGQSSGPITGCAPMGAGRQTNN